MCAFERFWPGSTPPDYDRYWAAIISGLLALDLRLSSKPGCDEHAIDGSVRWSGATTPSTLRKPLTGTGRPLGFPGASLGSRIE